MDRRLALTPLGKAPVVTMLAIGTIVPAAMGVALMFQVQDGRMSPLLMLALQAFVALSVLAVALPLWRREALFDGRRLQVKATFYTRAALLPEFDLAAARVVDLREHGAFRPRFKTNGYALPGMQAGHFRLRNGDKAFCLVTDPSRVLVLPHRDGRMWLLSLEHPQAVLDIFRRAEA